MPDLAITCRKAGDVVIVEPRGFINAHTAPAFESELNRLIREGDVRIVISGAHLSYVASAGFGVIMGLIEEVRAQGGDMRVSDLNVSVGHIYRVLGFDLLCRTFETEGEAVASFGGD